MDIFRRLAAAAALAAAVAVPNLAVVPAQAHDGSHATVRADELLPPLPELTVGTPEDDAPGGGGGQRPPSSAEPAGPADRVTAPRALVGPVLVSATATVGERQVPLLLPRSALPWRFHVDRALATRFGEAAVADAARQWDGIAGSRWATAYAGVVDGGGSAADGRSVIFAKPDCPADAAGYAYWQTANAQPDARYGDAALYLTDVDIAVCGSVTTVSALRAILAHEVGHAFGLAHLCNPGQACHVPAMGGGHDCRVMYWASSACRTGVNAAEQPGAVHVYPSLERLSGPTRVETAARASYAGFARGSAGAVVLARADGAAHGPLAASALAGALGAPLLLAAPDSAECLAGTAATELARVAADRARVVLVGDWPAACADQLASWDLQPEQIGGPDPARLSVAVADALVAGGRLGDVAVVVSAAANAAGHVPDGVAAGAAAGHARGPVLYSGPGRLDEPVRAWLGANEQVRRVYVLGGSAALSEQVLADLRAAGVEAIRVAGSSRVETALALAARNDLFGTAVGPVVVATAESWADAVTGSVVGARLGAPVLVSPRSPHPAVRGWLSAHPPAGGYLVGGAAALPYELQWDYARLVR